MADIVITNPFAEEANKAAAAVTRAKEAAQAAKLEAQNSQGVLQKYKVAARVIELAKTKFADTPLVGLDWVVAQYVMTEKAKPEVSVDKYVGDEEPSPFGSPSGRFFDSCGYQTAIQKNVDARLAAFLEGDGNILDLYKEVIENIRQKKISEHLALAEELEPAIQSLDKGVSLGAAVLLIREQSARMELAEIKKVILASDLSVFDPVYRQAVNEFCYPLGRGVFPEEARAMGLVIQEPKNVSDTIAATAAVLGPLLEPRKQHIEQYLETLAL